MAFEGGQSPKLPFPPGSEPKTDKENSKETELKRDSGMSGSGKSLLSWGGGTGRGVTQSPRSGNWELCGPVADPGL